MGKLVEAKSSLGITLAAEFAGHMPAGDAAVVGAAVTGVAPVSIWANAAGNPAISSPTVVAPGAHGRPVATAKAARGESEDVVGAESCMNKNPPWRTTAPIRGAE